MVHKFAVILDNKGQNSNDSVIIKAISFDDNKSEDYLVVKDYLPKNNEPYVDRFNDACVEYINSEIIIPHEASTFNKGLLLTEKQYLTVISLPLW